MRLEFRLREYRPSLADDPPVDLVGIGLDQFTGASKDRRAILERRRRPVGLGLRGGRPGLRDVGGVGEADRADLATGGGFDDRPGSAVRLVPGAGEDLAGPPLGIQQSHDASRVFAGRTNVLTLNVIGAAGVVNDSSAVEASARFGLS